MIAESRIDFSLYYNTLEPQMEFALYDHHGGIAEVKIGNETGLPDGSPPVDVMRMSFVIELLGTAHPGSDRDEDQPWYRYSSASLLDKVDRIFGDVAIRELKAGERDQMNKFKRSYDDSHQFRIVYKDGKTYIETNADETYHLGYSLMDGKLDLMTSQDRVDSVWKSAELMQIQGKSFVIEDAAKSNCENALASLGIQGHCDGNLWIEQL